MSLPSCITLRTVKGSVLSWAELDNNFICLNNSIENLSNSLLKNGNMWHIPSGYTLTLESDYQHFIYGDMVVEGLIQLSGDSQLVVLNGDLIFSGGSVVGTGTVYNIELPDFDTKVTGLTYSGDVLTIYQNDGTSYSATVVTSTDVTVTGGTYNPVTGVATFYNNVGGNFPVTGFLTGYTDVQVNDLDFVGNTLVLSQTNGTTFSANTPMFSGNTSGDCITDLFVKNLNSCSPLRIQNVSSGDVYIGENGGVNVGIGTSTPTAKLEVKSNSSTGNTVYPFSITNYLGSNILYLSNQNYYGVDPNNLGVYSYIYDNQFNIELAGSSGQFKLNRGVNKFWMNPYPNALGINLLVESSVGGGGGAEAGIRHVFTSTSGGGTIYGESLYVGTDPSTGNTTIVGKYIAKSNFTNPNATFYPLIVLDGNVGIGTSSPTRVLDSRGTFNLQPSTNTFLRFDSFMLEAQVGDSNNQLVLNRDNFGITDLKGSGGVVISNPTNLNSLSIGTNTILRENGKIVFSNSDNNVNGWWDIQNSRFRIGGGGYSPIYTSTTETFEVVGTSKITGNVGVGITGSTDVDTRFKIVGSDSSSSNFGLKVQNSGGTSLLQVVNNGSLQVGKAYNSGFNNTNFIDFVSPSAFSVNQRFSIGFDSKVYVNIDPSYTITGGGIHLGTHTFQYYSPAVISRVEVNNYDTTKNIGWIWDNPTGSTHLLSLITTDGSQRKFTLDQSTGNVGIGTGHQKVPSAKLQIEGIDSSSSGYGLKVQNGGGTDNLVVRNDGNVGIGTSTPTTKLEISGDTKLSSLSNVFKISSYTALGMSQGVGAANVFIGGGVVTDGLNGGGISIGPSSTSFGDGVSIGQTAKADSSAGDSIAIGRDSTANGTVRSVAIGRNATSSASNAWALGYNATANQDNTFIFGNSSDINIKSGFGTNAPEARIHIKGSDSSSSNYGLKIQNGGGTDNFVVRNDGYSAFMPNGPVKDIYFGDNARIQTSVGGNGLLSQFDLYNCRLSNALNGSDQSITNLSYLSVGYSLVDTDTKMVVRGSSSSNYDLKVQNSGGTDNFVVRNDGNVGIGTSTPSETLEVNGKTKTTNFQMTSGSTPGYVLTSDGSGNATWQPISSSSTTINNFYATNIEVTTIESQSVNTSYLNSNSPLYINSLDQGNIYFGSTSAITIDLTSNRLGIGTIDPSEKLEVNGNTKIIGSLSANTIIISGVTVNPKQTIALFFGHDSTGPLDSSTYYIGNSITLAAVTTASDGRRVVMPKTGNIVRVGICSTVGGTLGTSETSTVTINNTTQLTQSTITTGRTYDASSVNISYLLTTPLAVTEGDKVEIRWSTPAWVTNPTAIRQQFNVYLEY